MLVTDRVSIANTFNDFFSTIATKLSEKIVPANSSFDSYLKNHNPNSFYAQPVTEDEVSNYINSLETGKSNSPNSIPTNLLKIVSDIVSKPLAKIINESFYQGVFPDLLKIANVVPILKKVPNLMYRITDLFPFYPILVKYSKSSCTLDFQCLYKLRP